jgi:hypothetical protein
MTFGWSLGQPVLPLARAVVEADRSGASGFDR